MWLFLDNECRENLCSGIIWNNVMVALENVFAEIDAVKLSTHSIGIQKWKELESSVTYCAYLLRLTQQQSLKFLYTTRFDRHENKQQQKNPL